MENAIAERSSDVPGVVPAAAVGHDHLDIATAHRLQCKQGPGKGAGLVEHRNDDRDHLGRNHRDTAASGSAVMRAQASAPPQLLPCPAVQPKQWSRIAIGRPSKSAVTRSTTWVRGEPLRRIGNPSIWLKSQS